MTNIQNLIIASGQHATFSAVTKTATFKEGVFEAQEAGAYKFANFTIKDYATVTFETTGKALQLTILELHYGSTLKGEKIILNSNKITLNPGSTIDLSGGGHAAEQGTGKGEKVSIIIQHLENIIPTVQGFQAFLKSTKDIDMMSCFLLTTLKTNHVKRTVG